MGTRSTFRVTVAITKPKHLIKIAVLLGVLAYLLNLLRFSWQGNWTIASGIHSASEVFDLFHLSSNIQIWPQFLEKQISKSYWSLILHLKQLIFSIHWKVWVAMTKFYRTREPLRAKKPSSPPPCKTVLLLLPLPPPPFFFPNTEMEEEKRQNKEYVNFFES